MPTQIWITYDAFLVGAMVGIGVCFGLDSLQRKDRTMGWISVACLLIALRYTMIILGGYQILTPEVENRLQSILASTGYLAIVKSLTLVLPGHFPRRCITWFLIGISPNLIRVLFLPLDQAPALFIYYLGLVSYLFGCLLTIFVVIRAWIAKDPLGRRLGVGVVLTTFPVIAETLFLLILNKRLPLSGLGVMVIAFTVGNSWLWFITQDRQSKVARKDAETTGWRSLIPGITWHTGERSPAMNQLLGPHWNHRLDERVLGRDGIEYLVHRAPLEGSEEIGWLQAVAPSDTRPGIFFLAGWHVALGMDEGVDFNRVRLTLEAWGATVAWWGTVPPREGPYPSILIWAREPSILSVWREADMTRRKLRWIQVGGADIEGPHARLGSPVDVDTLRQTLQRLLFYGA